METLPNDIDKTNRAKLYLTITPIHPKHFKYK